MDDRERIEKNISDRRAAHAYLSAHSPVYQKFLAMEREAFSAGVLDQKTKELIAVGISVVISCESCMEWHIAQALGSGADKTQVMEAIGVGIEMGGGPATVSARFAVSALEYHLSRKP
jgi:AhpD family alkylhydroperoxidase